MLMVGQPKLTSEYIQASSRVGRSFPGVVFVQYDATKSRDRSHYERFRSYHESFYRFVEPTGVTPYSKPARERALHSVMTAMLRQRLGLCKDDDAIYFDKEYSANEIREIEEFIMKRIKSMNSRIERKAKDNPDEIHTEMQEFIDTWQNYVNECTSEGKSDLLYFGRRFMVSAPADGVHRLLRPFRSPGKDVALNTLTSMRNVDASVEGSVVIWEDNDA